MKWIDSSLVMIFYKKIKLKTDGGYGLHNQELLESAIKIAFQSYGGIELYPTIIDKIAIFTYSFIQDHPLLDGNKRVGVGLMMLLLKINNINIIYTQYELVEFAILVAKNSYKKNEIKEWIENHLI